MRMVTGRSVVPAGTAITASCTVLYFALPSAATTSSIGAPPASRACPNSKKSKRSAPHALNFFKRLFRFIRLLLHPLRRVEAATLLGRLDGDVLEAEGAGVVQPLCGLDAAEGAVAEAYVIDGHAGEADDPHHARARRARHVLDLDVTHDRLGRPLFAEIQKVNGEYGLGNAADLDVTHVNVLQYA